MQKDRFLIFVNIVALSCATAAWAQTDIIQSPAYKECIALANTAPAQAIAKADAWLAADNSVAAYHCRAMALYGLNRYGEAAEALTRLRTTIPDDNLTMRCFVTRQAVQAHLKGNHVSEAFAVMDAQIAELGQRRGNNASIAKLSATMLLERARLYIRFGRLGPATADLDHAISLTPLSVDLLSERARVFETLGDVDLARADAEAVLTLDPDNTTIRALLKRVSSSKTR